MFLKENVNNDKSFNDLNDLSRNLYRMSNDSNPSNNYPIEPVGKKNWKTLESPERLRRNFKFKAPRDVIYFVNELYKFQFKINHHCKIVVDNLNVIVETYTHDLNAISHQDIKIKKTADELFNDISYFEDEE